MFLEFFQAKQIPPSTFYCRIGILITPPAKLNTDFTSWIFNKDILGYADTLDPGAHCINYNYDCTNKPSNVWGTAYIHVRTKAAEITITAVDYDNVMYTIVKQSAAVAWTSWDRKVSTSDLQAKISFHRLTIIPTDNNPSTISRHILATAKNMDDNTAAIYLGDIPGYAYYRCIVSRTKNIILGTINIHESQYQFAYDMITDKLGGNFS